MINKSQALAITGLVVSSVCVPLRGADAENVRLALPGVGQLAGADLSEGWTLVAWKSTEQRWSRVEVFQDGERRAARDLQDILIKGARWAEPGERLVLDVVGPRGKESLLYSLSGDRLELEWSSRPVDDQFPSFTVSPNGDYWVGARFEVESAEVSLGRTGENTPMWTWHLDGARLGRPTRAHTDDFSYAFFVRGSGDPPDIGILWGARAWLARATSDHLVRIEPPASCQRINSVSSTEAGTWVECYHGIEAKNSHSWAYYPSGFSLGAAKRTPALVERFQAPDFLPDGTVLDQIAREGRSEVYRLANGRMELQHLGTIALPEDARVIVGGDALLVEEVDATDEYEVMALSETIDALLASSQ